MQANLEMGPLPVELWDGSISGQQNLSQSLPETLGYDARLIETVRK